MKIIRLNERAMATALDQTEQKELRILTIGAFDGFHLGHLKLLSKVSELAIKKGAKRCLLTFEPMPQEFFMRENLPRLMSFVQKIHFLKEKRLIDELYVMRFSAKLAQLTAAEFVDQLCALIDPIDIVVGDDFRFGAHASGKIDFLRQQSERKDFSVHEISTLCRNGERVSSSKIRQCMQKGDFATVKQLLGRPYSIYAKVVEGKKLARTLGFPTINLQLNYKTLPLQGVFVVTVNFSSEAISYQGVANIGYRPTVNGLGAILEVHIFNFSKMVYGSYCTVTFQHKLRDEQKFSSLDELKAAIANDAEKAKQYFLDSSEN